MDAVRRKASTSLALPEASLRTSFEPSLRTLTAESSQMCSSIHGRERTSRPGRAGWTRVNPTAGVESKGETSGSSSLRQSTDLHRQSRTGRCDRPARSLSPPKPDISPTAQLAQLPHAPHTRPPCSGMQPAPSNAKTKKASKAAVHMTRNSQTSEHIACHKRAPAR